MFIDKALQLSNKQALTASAASTSTINQGAKGDAYDSVFLHGIVGTAFATSNSATLQIAIQTADDSAFSTNLTTLYTTPALAAAVLTAGAEVLKIEMPYGTRQYIRAYYTVGTGTFTAGTITINGVEDVKI